MGKAYTVYYADRRAAGNAYRSREMSNAYKLAQDGRKTGYARTQSEWRQKGRDEEA